MKRLILALVVIAVMAMPCYGAEKINSFTDIDINEVKLHKWDSEVELKIKSPLKITVIKENQKFKQKKDKVEVHVYDLGDEGVEYEFYLSEIPLSNVFSLDLETKNLEFLYQEPWINPELFDNNGVSSERKTEGEMVGATRPINISGSYAVYHATKKNNEYKTGKAFHIYRPKAIDAKGNELWCDFNNDLDKTHKLNVVCDSTWLDKAVYPVLIDPTLGYTEVGGSFYDAANYWACSKFLVEADENGTASKIWIYTSDDSGRVKLSIYDGFANLSTRLVDTYEITAPVPTNQWNSVDISAEALSIVSGTSYYPYLAFESGGHGIRYDSSTGGHGYDTGETYANAFPASLTGNMTSGNVKISIYIEYGTATLPVTSTISIKGNGSYPRFRNVTFGFK